MRQTLVRWTLVFVVVSAAWAVGRAQSPYPPMQSDFEIWVSNDPDSGTTVTCIKGCRLFLEGTGQEGYKAGVIEKFNFNCNGRPCASGRIKGQIYPK